MASSKAPNIGLNFGWSLGESGWNAQMDENLKAIDALLMINVLSATIATPPASPTPGDRYLLPTGTTDAWTGWEGRVVRWDGAFWEFYTAKKGWEVRAQDTNQSYHFNGTDWAVLGIRYSQYLDDAAAGTGGIPLGGMYVNSTTGALSVRLI